MSWPPRDSSRLSTEGQSVRHATVERADEPDDTGNMHTLQVPVAASLPCASVDPLSGSHSARG